MPQRRNLMQEIAQQAQEILGATNPPIANGPATAINLDTVIYHNLDGVAFAGGVVSPPPAVEAAPAAGSGEFDTATLARQSSLALAIPQSVAIVGCGGVGSWIAYFLALAGVPELLLFDSDTVSETNLNRAPYGATIKGEATVGRKKTGALASFLLERRPRLAVECHPNLTPDFAKALNLYQKEGLWLAVSTDTWASRTAIYKWSANYGIDYIEASAEGDFGSIALSPADWATPLEENPGYASVPVWVGPCTSAATMACSYILHRNSAGSDVSARFGWADDAIQFNYHSEKPPATTGKEVA